MSIKTKDNKSFSPRKRKPKQTQFNSCNTGVNPIRTHGLGIWGNQREVMSIRVDSKLKTEGTKVLKAIFGSTCRGVESILASIIATYKQQKIDGVYPSNTSTKIEIGNLNILRNIHTRRKLVVEEETTVKEIIAKPVSCGFCRKEAFSIQKHVSGREQFACEFHSNMLKEHPKWSLLKVVNQ